MVPLGAVLATSLILGVSFGLSGLDLEALNADKELALSFVAMLLPLGIIGLYIKQVRNLPVIASLRLSRLNRSAFVELLKGLGWYILLSLSLLILAQIFYSGFDPEQEQDIGLSASDSPLRLGLMFLLLVVLTPLVEEIMFRGFMFPGMRNSWGWLAAALVSAGLFGLMHGQINVGLDTAAMGFVAARLRHQTDSLTPAILLHSIKNSVAFAIVFVLPLL